MFLRYQIIRFYCQILKVLLSKGWNPDKYAGGKKKVGFLFKTTLHAQNVKEEINYPVLKINGSVVIELVPQELRAAQPYSHVI